MSRIAGAKILITGGASGIGKLMGEICLEKGAERLIIWDRDPTKLQETIISMKKGGFQAEGHLIDISRTEEVIRLADSLLATYGEIDILINNAGIITGKFFELHSHEDIDLTMQVNTQAMMHITRVFLPSMLKAKKGHLVNIASAAGMASNPQMSVYVASKWAVIGWSESLRIELEQRSKGIRVTTVTPFYISTGMFEGVRSPVVPVLKPEKAARQILRDVERNRIFSRMPWIVYAMPLVHGILPQRWYDHIIGKWFGIHSSMKNFRKKDSVSE
jgi:short-subunit dehydrogenase